MFDIKAYHDGCIGSGQGEACDSAM